MTRFFYDCEFIEDGKSIDLISIGIVDESGREYYAVSSEFDMAKLHRNPFLVENVWPYLPQTARGMLDLTHSSVRPRERIAAEVLEFLTSGDGKPELWARWGAYDHVSLMWLWGTMVGKPDALPYYTRDLQQEIDRLQELLGREIELPEQGRNLHNALDDARHCLAVARLDEIRAEMWIPPIQRIKHIPQ